MIFSFQTRRYEIGKAKNNTLRSFVGIPNRPQWCIQNPIKLLRWSFFGKMVELKVHLYVWLWKKVLKYILKVIVIYVIMFANWFC